MWFPRRTATSFYRDWMRASLPRSSSDPPLEAFWVKSTIISRCKCFDCVFILATSLVSLRVLR